MAHALLALFYPPAQFRHARRFVELFAHNLHLLRLRSGRRMPPETEAPAPLLIAMRLKHTASLWRGVTFPRTVYLRVLQRQDCRPLCECFAFSVCLLVSHRSHSLGHAPLVLFALLLLSAPDGLTFRSLLPFHGLVEASHQLRPSPPNTTGTE